MDNQSFTLNNQIYQNQITTNFAELLNGENSDDTHANENSIEHHPNHNDKVKWDTSSPINLGLTSTWKRIVVKIELKPLISTIERGYQGIRID